MEDVHTQISKDHAVNESTTISNKPKEIQLKKTGVVEDKLIKNIKEKLKQYREADIDIKSLLKGRLINK